MTILELNTKIAALEAELQDVRKQRDASMIAAIQFKLGDRVEVLSDAECLGFQGTIDEVTLRNGFGVTGLMRRYPAYLLVRIDEHGNVLPPRREGE